MQGVLETALSIALRQEPPPTLTVAGRTDAGVHARRQVCHVDLGSSVWAEAGASGAGGSGPGAVIVRKLGGLLPADVRVRAVQVAPADFHARFAALARRYAYRIADDIAREDPLQRHYVARHPRPLDAAAMNAAAAGLLGEHDFTAYCRRRDGGTTIRTLLQLRCERARDGTLRIDVEADAFCHQMVRSLVGALVAVGDGRRALDWPTSLLAAHHRESAVTVMPAHGLTLEEVRYPPDDQLLARTQQARVVRRLGAPD